MSARRSKGEGSIQQRKDGRWVAVLDLGWHNGKRVRKSLYGRTKGEVQTKLADHARKLPVRRGSGVAVAGTSGHTVETWLRYWLDEVAVERVRPGTWASYDSKVRNYLVPLIGRHKLDRLEPSDVRSLWRRLRQACPNPTADDKCPHDPSHGLSEATLRQTHAVLSRALKIAQREGHVTQNVAQLVDPPSTKKATPTPLTIEEARQVLSAVDDASPRGSRWWAALMLGMRQGEALGLQWRDVDLDAGTITVSRTVQRIKGKGLVLGSPKSDTSARVIPVPTMVLSRLKVTHALAVQAAAERADGVDLAYAFVWGSPTGDPLTPRDPARDWQDWVDLLDRAGVRRVRLHAARNTAASLLMHAGVPDRIIAEILGHATVQLTRDVYLRGDDRQRREAMTQLEAFVGELTPA